MKIFGKRVVELRNEQYLSRDELAARAEMTRSNLQRIEQAEIVGVTPATLRKLNGPADLAGELDRALRDHVAAVVSALERDG